MCDEYVHTLELPFNADEDEVIRTKIGTYKSKFQSAEMDISLLPAFRFEGKWNAQKDTIVAYLKEHTADVLILPLIDQNTKTVYNKADVVNQLAEALDYRYVYYAPCGTARVTAPAIWKPATAPWAIWFFPPILC